jgi:hypothetical protein
MCGRANRFIRCGFLLLVILHIRVGFIVASTQCTIRVLKLTRFGFTCTLPLLVFILGAELAVGWLSHLAMSGLMTHEMIDPMSTHLLRQELFGQLDSILHAHTPMRS